MQLRFSALNLRPLAALLILVALLIGGSIDAVACEPELTASAQVEAASDGPSNPKSDDKDEKYAACAHGHCHYCSNALVARTGDFADAFAAPAIHFGSREAGLTSTASSLPKPPPRA